MNSLPLWSFLIYMWVENTAEFINQHTNIKNRPTMKTAQTFVDYRAYSIYSFYFLTIYMQSY